MAFEPTPFSSGTVTPAVELDPKVRSSEEKDGSELARLLARAVQIREAAQIQPRELGVAFEDLHVTGVGASTTFAPTVGSLFNPLEWVKAIQQSRHASIRNILSGFEGSVKPGEMLLVLGSPGSGCTTLLKALSNQRSSYHSVNGNVYYDSLTHQQVDKHYRGDVIFCPEDDIHFPTLTVEQTIQFAAKCRAPHERAGFSKDQYIKALTDTMLTVFGLGHARYTKVGDAAIRGVSGGEKKRVSICEVLATRASIVSWDNSTRGLDASTALEFVQALRTATDIAKLTTIVSLYQAGENLYSHFDKVCVVYEGKMAYFGPASKARDYFIEMGYEPANRQTTPDFLTAVTDPNARILRSSLISPPPRTAVEFAEYFKNSAVGRANRCEIDEFKVDYVGNVERTEKYNQSAQAERANHTRKASPYTVSLPMQARAVMLRRYQMMKGSWLITAINMFSFLFQGIIMGTVFLQMSESTSAYFSRGGILFFMLLFSVLITVAEIPGLFVQRPVILRHRDWALYHPFVDQIALFLVDIPVSFICVAILDVTAYQLSRLQQTASQFFILFLFTFVTSLSMKAFFRALTAACKEEHLAQTFAGVVTLITGLYTGYALPTPSMIGALRWLIYINPVRYAFDALMANEFHTLQGSCQGLVPQGPGYENVTLANQVCPVVGAEPGQPFVDGSRFIDLSYGYSYDTLWENLIIIIAFGIGFFILLLVIAEVNTKSTTRAAAIVLYLKKSRSGSPPHVSKIDEEKVADNTAANDVLGERSVPHERLETANDVFSWQDLCYSVPVSDGKTRRLLHDVSGYVAPGKLTALMGESGAGKTTLLNVLAQRTDVGVVTGDRFVNGQALPADFQSQTGYCQQQDTHVGGTTVREALLFSAVLRQPHSVSHSEKEQYVDKCLDMCGLTPYRDAMVGTLNTEYRKRTTIAVELAAKPRLLLFLDEPTSGLDSQSSWAIVSFLRHLADSGQAILCTIHQPSAELFQVFDRLLLLRKGGETVYFGDIGHHATTMIQYFERNGSRKCESGENPAEFMLDVIGAGASAQVKEDWFDIWKTSSECTALITELSTIHSDGRQKPAATATTLTGFATPWWFQFKELLKRDYRVHYRDPTYMTAKFGLNIVAGLLIGFTFFNQKLTQAGVQNFVFAVFMGIIISIALAQQLQLVFINMRTVYEIRERPSRMYSWTALIAAQFWAEVPWNLVGSTLFFFCWYWTVGFPTNRAGYSYLMIGVVFPFYYTSVGQALAAMSGSIEIAAILFSFLFSFVITFCGTLQPYRELGWWQWMYWTSPFTYFIKGFLGQAIGNRDLTCSPIELVSIIPPTGMSCQDYMDPYISYASGYLLDPASTGTCQYCFVRNTDEFLEGTFNIKYSDRWTSFAAMIGWIGFNFVAMFVLTYWFRIRTGSVVDVFRKRRT